MVTVRATDAARALPYLKRVQRAFYAQGRDVTQPGTLADLAAEEGLERGVFLAALASQEARDAVRQDFAATQQTGVTGFPTLAVAYPDRRDSSSSPRALRAPPTSPTASSASTPSRRWSRRPGYASRLFDPAIGDRPRMG